MAEGKPSSESLSLGLVVPENEDKQEGGGDVVRQGEAVANFLERHQLGFLSSKLEEEGFVSVEDVLCLTPRKYDAIGAKGLGTKSKSLHEERG